MNTKQLFADHIRTFRLSRGWTQEQMAELLSTNREILSKYETATRGISLKTILTWAKILDVEPSSLIPSLKNL